ncbi:MAG TPA: hypothetical protein VII34_07295 [Pyrinomonadaceae bacterium]|jgi:hypothetical protein
MKLKEPRKGRKKLLAKAGLNDSSVARFAGLGNLLVFDPRAYARGY